MSFRVIRRDGKWHLDSRRGIQFEVSPADIEALRISCVEALANEQAEAEHAIAAVGDVHRATGGVYNGRCWVVFQRAIIADFFADVCRRKPWAHGVEIAQTVDLEIVANPTQTASGRTLFKLVNRLRGPADPFRNLGSFDDRSQALTAQNQLSGELLEVWGDRPPEQAEDNPRRHRRLML